MCHRADVTTSDKWRSQIYMAQAEIRARFSGSLVSSGEVLMVDRVARLLLCVHRGVTITLVPTRQRSMSAALSANGL
jgi:hypothetical protein